jgi:hypothetical protein
MLVLAGDQNYHIYSLEVLINMVTIVKITSTRLNMWKRSNRYLWLAGIEVPYVSLVTVSKRS